MDLFERQAAIQRLVQAPLGPVYRGGIDKKSHNSSMSRNKTFIQRQPAVTKKHIPQQKIINLFFQCSV
jgi:hypothetical protein